MGGENRYPRINGDKAGGSSPRGRGKLKCVTVARPVLRLIPAWAGKTCDLRHIEGGLGAHPRVGGENSCAHPRAPARGGSSPRGRGKRGG